MIIRESKDIVSGGKSYKVTRYKYNAFDDKEYDGPRLKRGTKTSDYFWADSNSTIEYSRIYNESVILDSYVIGDLIVGSELNRYTSWQESNIIVDSSISNTSLFKSYVLSSSLENVKSAGLIIYNSSIHEEYTGDGEDHQAHTAYYSCIKNFKGNAKDIYGINLTGMGTFTMYKQLNGDEIISCLFDCDDYGECENDGLFRAVSGRSKEDYSFIKGYLNNPELFFRCYTEEQLRESIKKYGDIILKLLKKDK